MVTRFHEEPREGEVKPKGPEAGRSLGVRTERRAVWVREKALLNVLRGTDGPKPNPQLVNSKM